MNDAPGRGPAPADAGCPAKVGGADMRRAGRASSGWGVARRYGALMVIATAMALVFLFDAHHLITLENVVIQRDRFHRFLDEHACLSVLAYVAVYALAVALSLPGGLILTVTGGLLFGALVGGLAAVLAASIGATIVFLIARTAVGETLSERVGPWLGKLSEGFQKEALSYMLFLRLVPVFPFWFVNIAPALLGVPLKTYVIGTVLGILPATFAFASAGAGLDSVIMAAKNEHAACVESKGADACRMKIHASSLLTKELLLALVLLGVVALIPVVLKRWRKRHAAAK
jgi:uncharacterized membrane protein YdjX (TVP38/TMEM64 family)